ncbi:MAG: hypothetical protein PWP03_192 [Candidatus Woesearchaeota archaeon]|nr:hypothetical protein [Candidatus Woesearchaeota archaeon]MDN5327554.1 hypothetical protein [Candidatus Woesearchaeota archaeon]
MSKSLLKRIKETSLEDLIQQIYFKKELLKKDEFRYYSKKERTRERLINYEITNHKITPYKKILDKKIKNSLKESFLLEHADFAKALLYKEIPKHVKRELDKEIRKETKVMNKAFMEIYNRYTYYGEVKREEALSILRKIDPDAILRPGPVIIRGGEYIPPKDYYSVQNELLRFEEEILKQNIEPVKKAFHIHYHFVRIHPFIDGNGRSARVWSNAYLYYKEFFPLVIPLDEREYYAQLLDDACVSRSKADEMCLLGTTKSHCNLTSLTKQEEDLFKYFAIKIIDEYDHCLANKRNTKNGKKSR